MKSDLTAIDLRARKEGKRRYWNLESMVKTRIQDASPTCTACSSHREELPTMWWSLNFATSITDDLVGFAFHLGIACANAGHGGARFATIVIYGETVVARDSHYCHLSYSPIFPREIVPPMDSLSVAVSLAAMSKSLV